MVTPLAPVRDFGIYLPVAVGGQRWLYDPAKLPDNPWQETPNHRLDPSAAAADLRDLGDLLAHDYSQYGRYAVAGLDVPALIAREADRVQALPTVTAAQAFEPTFRALEAAVHDQHLAVFIGGSYERSFTDPHFVAREYRGPLDALDGARRTVGSSLAAATALPELQADGSVRTVGSVSAFNADPRGGLAQLGYRAMPTTAPIAHADGPAYLFTRIGDVGVIRLATFSADDAKAVATLNQLIAQVPEQRACRTLVFDLRGNSGGSDEYMNAWSAAMRSTASTLDDFAPNLPAAGPQALAHDWNMAAYDARYDSGTDRSDAQATLTQLRSQLPIRSDLPPSTPSATPMHGTADSDWHGQVVAVVDHDDASSGEDAALMLKHWFGATIVGERTAGAQASGDVAPFPLPRTGVTWQIAQSAYATPDTIEGAGMAVDVGLADPSMPIAQIVANLPAIQAAAAHR